MNETAPTGRLTVKRIIPPQRPAIRNVKDALKYGRSGTNRLTRAGRFKAEWQRRNAVNFVRSLRDQESVDASNVVSAIGYLWLAKVDREGEIWDLGLASCRVVTTVGVGYIVDAFQGLVEPENMKFHALGTGSGSEAVGNTQLGTELTTQYAVANTRVTGTLGELSGNPNTFETTATITVSTGATITEHGIFSTSGTGTGVLLDRTLFAGVPLATGESILSTYDLAFPAGS